MSARHGLADNGAFAAELNRFVGDPVDVVTGHVTDRIRCFRLIGPLLLDWTRFYDSGRNQHIGGFGYGHSHAYYYRLRFDADGLSLEDPVGKRTGFPPLLTDGERHTAGGTTLERVTLKSYRLRRPGQPSLEFVFTAPDRPARIARVIEGNAAIHFHNDRLGRLTGITHSTGLRIDAEEDSRGRLLRLQGAWDGTTPKPILACEYDDAGNLIGMTDAFESHWSFAYDAANRMVRNTDRRGYSFYFEYDSAGRCVRSAGEDGLLGVVLRYRTEERITEVKKADGGIWQYFYDGNGAITLIIGPYGQARRFIKGEDGRTVGEIDPLGNSLEYVFNRRGALIGKRFSTGRVIEVRGGIEFADPPPHRVADRSLQWDWGDVAPRLAVAPETEAAIPAELRRAVPAEPPPVPDGPSVPPCCEECDPWYPEPEAGRQFDSFGHLLAQELPGGGRRHWTHDRNDNMEAYKDADGAVTKQIRGSWNQLHRRIDAMGGETRYRWTAHEKLASLIDPGETCSEYAWDQHSRLLGVRRGGAVRETYCYDAAGNLIEKRDGAGRTLVSLTQTADRLVAERRLASGDVHQFTYNAAGRFLTAKSDAGEVQFAYDAFGQRTLDQRDAVGVEHAFAGPGLLAATTVLGRYAIRFEHNAVTGSVTIRLPGRGWLRVNRYGERRFWRTCSNGTSELTQYDWLGHCVFRGLVSLRGERRPWIRHYRYSHEGDLQSVEDNREGTTRYGYDPAHRLIGAEQSRGRAETFAYDKAGNLLLQPGLEGVQIDGGNQLARANGESFVYDASQHMAERRGPGGNVLYRYDSRGILLACEGSGGISWRAEYDAIGRRTRVEQGGAEWRFYWDTDRLAAELSPDGAVRIYVYAGPLAQTPLAFIEYPQEGVAPEDGQPYFVFADQRGAPVLVEDGRGEPVWQARLAPYGTAVVTAPGGLTLNLRLPGHYFDAATGLHYNRFRYYDPVLGRYLQSDPIGIAGGMNVYAYPGNPLARADVRGLEGEACELPKKNGQGEDNGDKEEADQPKKAAAKDADLGGDGLTDEQRAEFRQKIDNPPPGSTADDMRFERYQQRCANQDREPLSREEWQASTDQLNANRARGSEAEDQGREGLKGVLDRPDLKNNNSGQVVQSTFKDPGTGKDVTTRPDTIGYNDEGKIDTVHDHKDLSGEDKVAYDTAQMRAQRAMLQDPDGNHNVTLSSDKPNLDGQPPEPRPSRTLGDNSDVYYTKDGEATHKWVPDPNEPGGGYWSKL